MTTIKRRCNSCNVELDNKNSYEKNKRVCKKCISEEVNKKFIEIKKLLFAEIKNSHFDENVTRLNENNNYVLTEQGKVYRLTNRNDYYEVKGAVLKNGYKVIVLTTKDSNKRKYYYIHRLVAEYFIENPHNDPCINHIDGNKLNNHVTNLEWCNYSYNNQHAYDTGLKERGENFNSAKLSQNDVRVIRDMIENKFKVKDIANKFNVTVSCIKQIKNGYTWKHLKR